MVKARGSLWSCITNLAFLFSAHSRSFWGRRVSPAKSLLVVAVDLASFLELRHELADALSILLGVEVNDEGVDHFGGILGL